MNMFGTNTNAFNPTNSLNPTQLTFAPNPQPAQAPPNQLIETRKKIDNIVKHLQSSTNYFFEVTSTIEINSRRFYEVKPSHQEKIIRKID